MAEIFLESQKDDWSTICIVNSDNYLPEPVFRKSIHLCELKFDDIDCPLTGYMMPTRKDVQDALDFAKGKDRLLVTCKGGVTRSAAIAYVVKCNESKNPREAIKLLSNNIHHPNYKIIKYGTELLENNLIFDVYNDWAIKAIIRDV